MNGLHEWKDQMQEEANVCRCRAGGGGGRLMQVPERGQVVLTSDTNYRRDPSPTKRAQKSHRDECWAEHNQARQCVAKPTEQEVCLFYLHMQNTKTTKTQLTRISQIYESIVTTGPTNAHTSLEFLLLCALPDDRPVRPKT
jgi:hypothetical protein